MDSRSDTTIAASTALLQGIGTHAIFMLDRGGRITSWSPGSERVTAFLPGDVNGMPLSIFYSEDERQTRSLDFEILQAREGGIFEENRHWVRKDGTKFWANVVITPLLEPVDHQGFVAVIRDITGRKEIDEQLATSQAMFKALFEQAPDAIIAVDRRGRMVQTNRRVQEMFGYTAEELVNQSIELLVPERFRQLHVHQRDDYMGKPRSRPMGGAVDLMAKRKDGSEIPVDIMLSPVLVPGGSVVISVVRDITERKVAERELKDRAEQLAHSNKELEQFAYVASHDLQEPLRAVATSCQIMQKRLAGKFDDDTNEYIQFAIDGSKRMQELISDLLTYSRASRGRKQSQLVDLALVLERVLQNLGTQVETTKAVITHTALPAVHGDFGQLVQLFQNLISNAMKFHGGEAPKVHLSVVELPDKWIFAVKDNGIGIQPQYLEKIFVIFQRLHRREEYPGTGIGLAICKKIVENHGGKIWVEAVVGSGSTFYFTIPQTEIKT